MPGKESCTGCQPASTPAAVVVSPGCIGSDLAAQCGGDELCPQADAHDGQVAVVSLADQVHLALQPRMLVGVGDVHRPAHRDQAIGVVQVGRQRVTGVELDDVEAVALVAEVIAQPTWGFERVVLEDEDRHGGGV